MVVVVVVVVVQTCEYNVNFQAATSGRLKASYAFHCGKRSLALIGLQSRLNISEKL